MGALFWDRIKEYNLMSNTKEFEYAGVNPCAEEPLPAGGSCLLGSINLSEFVLEPFTTNAKFDYDSFKETVNLATIALNEVLDEGLPLHPLKEQRESVEDWRQIGLGTMGLGDCLIKLGIEYGSEKSLMICDLIAFTMANQSIKASAELAKKLGKFNKCNIKEIMSTDFFQLNTDIETRDLVARYGLRNSQLLTCAPTGTISTLLQISGGLEPIFSNFYTRKTQSLHKEGDVFYKVYTKIVKDYMDKNNIKDDEDLPDYFVTAQTLYYKQRINMQSVWQNHIDASISSTVNVPNSFTKEQVYDLYLTAWEKGLKGITIYRDGCKREGVLTLEETKLETKLEEKTEIKSKGNNKTKLGRGDILLVNDDLLSAKRTIVNGCGKFYIHSDFDEDTGEQLETFIDMGTGGCERNLQFISRLMSLLLRSGVPVEAIIDQAMTIRPCTAYKDRTKAKGDTSKGTSCPSAIGYALSDLNKKIQERCFADYEEYNEENFDSVCEESSCATCKNPCNSSQEVENKTEIIENSESICPDCGSKLRFEGGCNICVGDETHSGCGFTKCS